MYNRLAPPSWMRSIALLLSMGSSRPLMVTASVIPFFSRLSTWSFIRDWSGEMITVSPFVFSPLIRAGTWKVMDFPPPVGKTANNDLPSMAAFTAFFWRGSLPYVLNSLNPKYRFNALLGFSASSQKVQPCTHGFPLRKYMIRSISGKLCSTQGGVMEYRSELCINDRAYAVSIGDSEMSSSMLALLHIDIRKAFVISVDNSCALLLGLYSRKSKNPLNSDFSNRSQ